MDPIEQPTHLDDEKKFLIFSLTDVLIIGGAVGVGLIAQLLGYTLILSLGLMWMVRRFRGAVPDGHLQHRMYWYGVPVGSGHGLVNPYIRRFVG